MFDDLSQAPYVFYALFFGFLFTYSVCESASPGACPGFKPDFKHAAEHPLNMPFHEVKHFDLSKVGYSKFQKFRISFGISFSVLFLMAGFIGTWSTVLDDYEELKKFAWNPITTVGALFLFLHSQMTWERLHNGNQIADIKAFLPCISCRFVIGNYVYHWLQRVLELEEVMVTQAGKIMTLCIKVALVMFATIDVIRLVQIGTKGQSKFFAPQVTKQKVKA